MLSLPLSIIRSTWKEICDTASPYIAFSQGARSAAFPLLKRLHAEMGSKTVTTMLVSHPLPDDIKHALKRQQPQQAQQQQQHVPEGSGPQWSLAAAALTAGAAAASAAIAGVACRESPRPSGNSAVSAAQNITPELLQRLQHSQHEETILKALQELMSIFVNKAGDKLKPDGGSLPVCIAGRTRSSRTLPAVYLLITVLIFSPSL